MQMLLDRMSREAAVPAPCMEFDTNDLKEMQMYVGRYRHDGSRRREAITKEIVDVCICSPKSVGNPAVPICRDPVLGCPSRPRHGNASECMARKAAPSCCRIALAQRDERARATRHWPHSLRRAARGMGRVPARWRYAIEHLINDA